jgi:hypothetical protein
MGKFLDTLQQVGKVSGVGIGFLGRRAQTKVKPAVIVAALALGDVALAEAAVKGGAEAVMLPVPDERGSLAEWIKLQEGVLEATHSGGAAVGLLLGGSQMALEADDLQAAIKMGVDFVVLEMMAPARLLGLEESKLDKVVMLSIPRDEQMALFLRAVNLLPVGAVIFEPALTAEKVRALTLEAYMRYRLVRESLRFPALVVVEDALSTAEVKMLVELGLQGIILRAAARERSDVFRERVVALRELLEEAPRPESLTGEVPRVGDLAGSPSVPQPQPQPER